MKNYVCMYIIEVANIKENETEEVYGLLEADSFTDAIKELEDNLYGDDLLSIKEMELLDTASIEFSKEVYALVKKELNS